MVGRRFVRVVACPVVALAGLVLAASATATTPPRATQSACVGIVFGAAPSSAAITPAGDEDCFTFTGAVGDRIRVRLVETSGNLVTVHEVRRPNGSTVCAPNRAIETTCALDTAGTHKVMVRDELGTRTGQYRIAVQRLNNPVGCTALSFGAAPSQKTITLAAEIDCFSFAGANLDDIRIRIVKSDPAATVVPQTEVVRENGTTRCGRGSPVDRTCVLDSAGTHRIIVRDAGGAGTGAYRIQIQRLNNPLRCPAISLGATGTAGDIATSPEMDCYSYNATTPAQKIRVRVAEKTGSLFAAIEVIRPNGTRRACAPESAIEVTCALDATGTHRILVRDVSGPNTGQYGVSLRRLNGTPGCEALTTASVIRPISEAAEQDCYAFSAQFGTTYAVELAGFGGFVPSIEWIRPDGTTVCGPHASTSAFAEGCTVDVTGTHQIIIRDHSSAGTDTGDYFLQVE